MKVYHNGRDITGQFVSQDFKKRLTNKIKKMWYWAKVFLGVGFVGAVIGGFFVGALAGWSTTYTRAEEPIVINTMPAKIEALKDEVVKDLEACESVGHTEDDAIVVFDNNKSGTLKKKDIPSFGVLQFKVSTVQDYKKLITGEVLTNKQAVLLALEAAEARNLAKSIIFETDGGLNNWLNCSRKHGLQARVDLIKKLEN